MPGRSRQGAEIDNWHYWSAKVILLEQPEPRGFTERTQYFTEEERANGIEYSRLTITLHKVVEGNARSSPITKQGIRSEASPSTEGHSTNQ